MCVWVSVSVWETHYLAMQASQVDRLILPSITALWMQLHAEEVGSVLKPVVAPVKQVDVHVSAEFLQLQRWEIILGNLVDFS